MNKEAKNENFSIDYYFQHLASKIYLTVVKLNNLTI